MIKFHVNSIQHNIFLLVLTSPKFFPDITACFHSPSLMNVLPHKPIQINAFVPYFEYFPLISHPFLDRKNVKQKLKFYRTGLYFFCIINNTEPIYSNSSNDDVGKIKKSIIGHQGYSSVQ